MSGRKIRDVSIRTIFCRVNNNALDPRHHWMFAATELHGLRCASLDPVNNFFDRRNVRLNENGHILLTFFSRVLVTDRKLDQLLAQKMKIFLLRRPVDFV